jgi:environmental stress-induced protein Ves
MTTPTTLIRCDDVVPQPWRNGGGQTRELMTWPDAADWRVRISVATIEADGPFSAFAGVERWFGVLEGGGVELSVEGEIRRLLRGDPPLRFRGSARTDCRLLDGPTRDLNLMLRDASGRMSIAQDGVDWRPPQGRCGLFAAVAGECRSDGVATAVPAHALLWFERSPQSLSFHASEPPASDSAIGWWLEVQT